MVRFLTPAKVTLLLLASLYTQGSVPLASSTAVLSFLVRSILPHLKTSAENEEISGTISISQFENNLTKHESSMPGRTVWDLLLKRLWTLDCSDAVDFFITNLPCLLAKPREQIIRERDRGEASDEPAGKIVRTSPLGVFIRRCHLEYTRLQFQDSVAIWQDLIAYRLPTRGAYERKSMSDGRNMLDANLSEMGIDLSHPLVGIMFAKLLDETQIQQRNHSSHDVERLLEFQVSEMQRIGGRLPEEMRVRLDQLAKAGSQLPKPAHYLRFLDAWRAGDFASAFDNLHRYFDYTMQTRDRTFYQYALLNLAILQADFGCHSEAIPAIQEAIATARENKDTTCLNFCMSWLYHFGRSFPREMRQIRDKGILGSEVEGLQFLKSRAKDAEMWSLLSSCLLSEAKLGLQHGESIATIFENIVKASHINIVKSLSNITGPVLLMKAAVFTRIGQSHMAFICGEMFLECHKSSAPLEDVLKCTCRMASLLVQQGRYSEAESLMSNVPAHVLRVLKYQQYWSFYASLLKLQRYLRRGDLETAILFIDRLNGFAAPDTELKTLLAFLEMDYYVRKSELSTALSKLEHLAEETQSENVDIMMQSKLLTSKAKLFAKAGKPLKGFSVTMQAASLAYNARVLPSLWEAILALSHILINVQEFSAARLLLEAILPQVFECQDCSLAAQTCLQLTDTFMGFAGLEDENPSKRKEYVGIAMEYIDQAFEQWKRVEDLDGQLDCLSKKAKVQFWRGDTVVANDTANKCLEISKSYTVSMGLTG